MANCASTYFVRYFHHLLLVMSIMTNGLAQAQCPSPDNVYTIRAIQDEYNLNACLMIVEDPNDQLTIRHIINNPESVSFFPIPDQSSLNPNWSYWLKLQLRFAEDIDITFDNWKLFIGKPDMATIYLVNAQGDILFQDKTGGLYPSSEKRLKFGNKVQRINVRFASTNDITFYIKYEKQDMHPLDIDIQLRKYDFYQSLNYILDNRRDWLFLGFILTMIVFNMIVFWSTRYLAFLYHGLFILGIFIFTLDFFGVSDDLWFVRDRPYLVQLLDYIGLALMDIGYFQFIRYYFDLRKKWPKWDRLFLKIIGIKVIFFVAITIFYYATFNEPIADKIAATFIVAQYLFILAFLVPVFRTREKKAYYIIAGTLFLFMAVLLNSISIINERGIWTLMTEIGLTGEIICFSLGLGVRFRELRDEEQEASRLKELDAYKTKLLTNITHEFRTPLTVIQGVNELVREQLGKGSSKLKEGMDAIERNSKDLLHLINQMLDLAKLESKDMQINYFQKDMVLLLQQKVVSMKPLAESSKINLKFASDLAEFPMDLDQSKIETIVTNLLSNAIKFTPEDGVVQLEFSVDSCNGRSVANIQISDTGYGIDKSDLPYIFDRFHRVETGPAQKISGTGVGLALVKELVALFDGKIDVKSRLGAGSEFKISLPVSHSGPIVPIEDVALGIVIAEPNAGSRPFILDQKDRPILLIVEDNKDVMNYLVSLLEDQYIIELAYDGTNGKSKALQLVPDLIISDVMMPGIDGIELCRILKQDELTNHIPIVLLTAKAEFEDRLSGLEHGADAYLTKPFERQELLVRLAQLNALRKALQAKYSQFGLIDEPGRLKKASGFIYKANAVIDQNLQNEQFGVEDLAKGLLLSRMQLHRKLKALSDRSASNYIRNYRLYKSKPLLHDPSLSIAEIAWQVGFQDANYFTKSFNKEFDMTPSEFRQKDK